MLLMYRVIQNIFRRCAMSKKAITESSIGENDKLYKLYYEYRYQPTAVLHMERIKLMVEKSRLEGDINLYLSGVVFLMSFYTVFLALGNLGIPEYDSAIKSNIKFCSIMIIAGVMFLLSVPPYFYTKKETKVVRIGMIDYILMCRKDGI